jgi:hypothetical protein
MLSITPYETLSETVGTALTGYIRDEFGHIPVVRQTRWATPDWTLLHNEDGETAAFYNVVERTILCDGMPLKTAGINNGITRPAFRGRGLTSTLLRDTMPLLFDTPGVDLGLLDPRDVDPNGLPW